MQPSADRRPAIPAIDKAVVILNVLAANGEPVTFSQLASQVVMARSSVHDVCSALVRTGLAEKSADGKYQIGMKLVELSRHRLASMQLVQAFQRVSRSMGRPVDTVVLSVLNGPDVIYVSFIDGNRPLAVRYEIGMRLPAAFTASGKAMLATLPEREVRSVLGASVRNPRDGAVKLTDDLLTELQDGRERGFCIDDEETAPGMACIGSPIFAGGSDSAVGAVAVSVVKSATSWYDEDLTGYLRGLAGTVTQELGGRRSVRW